ncbi:MAG: cobalamin-binding protein [Oscillospiraceae bacterium]|nr:cobalamin-binding protein [Oscillospiraceae bacterium]
MSIINEINEAMQKGKAKQVKQLIPQALEEGIPAQQILNEGLLDAMSVVGEKFKNNEVFVPEVLVAARAMNAGTALLKPYLSSEGGESKGKACIGTVEGDLHDIGKNLVRMMLEGKGLEVIDLGVDVTAEKFLEAVQNEGVQLVCCSALLTTTMPNMSKVIDALKAAGVRDSVKVMVGGAPVTPEFAESIGADAYTPDAASAANKAVELLAG